MRQVVVSKLNKTRPRRRPHQRWLDRVKKDLMQVDKITIIEDADNRDRWRGLVKASKGLRGL
jgi:membrane protein Man1